LLRYRAALDFRPPDPEIHTKTALMLARLKRLTEAQSELEAALKLDPNFGPAKQMLQDVLSRMK
jgi:Flp pilus assembly protein TadD